MARSSWRFKRITLTLLFLTLVLKTDAIGLLWWFSGKESTCQCRRNRFNPWSGRSHMLWSNSACACELCVCACVCVLSCVWLFVTLWTVASRLHKLQLLSPWDFPGKNTGVGCHFLLQGIFLTQGSNPRLLQSPGRQVLYFCATREALETENWNYWSPGALEPLLHKRSHCNEKPERYNWKVLHWPQLEKSPHSNEDPAPPKIKINE